MGVKAFGLGYVLVLLSVLFNRSAASFSPSNLCPKLDIEELLLLQENQCIVDGDGNPLYAAIAPGVAEVNGTTLERVLNILQTKQDAYAAILFYANWCPFSRTLRPLFETLASTFPGIYHIAVEDTAIQPSGIWAMIAVFLGYSLLQAPSTILIRPHPSVWRLVHGIAVVYLVFLLFILFQTRDDARHFMKHLHKDLGVELPEKSYGSDCRLYTPENTENRFINLYETVMDEFVIAHALGWWGKAIMIRNVSVLWILSIGFEMMEVTFKHMLPNFNECWWDSIILDVLICNWLGIWIGMKTVRYFDGKTYEWVGLSRQPNILGKVKRSLSQFTPAYWDKDEWELWSGPFRFVQVLGLVIIILTVELNAFFLKYCLWIPPSNPLNTYRLVIWWLIANPAIREYNAYLQVRKPIKKVGAFALLSLAICLVEVLICIKFGQGLYPEPMPKWVLCFWLLFGLVFLCFLLVWSYKVYYKSHLKTGDIDAIQTKKVA